MILNHDTENQDGTMIINSGTMIMNSGTMIENDMGTMVINDDTAGAEDSTMKSKYEILKLVSAIFYQNFISH